MTLRHGLTKRGLSEMPQGQVQKTSSVKLSPPNKKKKEVDNEEKTYRNLVTKNLEIKSLKQAVEEKKELLTNQAIYIEELKKKIEQQELQNQTRDTEKANDNEVSILKQSIEAANRKIFACESEALHLAEENKRIKIRANKDIDDLEEFIKEHEKSVSRTKKILQITVEEKNNHIKYLTEKLKAKENANQGEEQDVEEGQEEIQA